MSAKFSICLATILVISLTACKEAGRYDGKDLNPGQVVRQNVAGGGREIIIFYGNETPDTQEMKALYERILSSVDSLNKTQSNPLYDRIRSSYSQDIAVFPSQIRKDVAGLKKQICSERRYNAGGLFVFTNELARQGKFEFCLLAPYTGEVLQGTLSIAIPDAQKGDFRFAQSPLSLDSSMRAARDAIQQEMAQREMPEADFSYIWISKSHGGADMMMVPKLLHRVDLMTDEQLGTHFRKTVAAATYSQILLVDLKAGDSKLGDVKVGELKLRDVMVGDLKAGDLKVGDLKVGDLKVGDLKLGDLKADDLKVGDLKVGDLKLGDLKVGDLKVGDLKVGDLKVGDLKVGDLKVGDLKVGDLKVGDLKVGDLKVGDLSAANPLTGNGGPGVSKDRFIDEIKAFSLPFRLLFFESCDSQLPEALLLGLKKKAFDEASNINLGTIFTSDRFGLRFETVDYGAMPASDPNSFSESLKVALDALAKQK